MHLRFAADTPAPPAVLFDVVSDLTTFSEWLELVHRVEPAEPSPGDGGPAFVVDLRARLGPLARSKRLRMVRVEHHPVTLVRYARRELDERRHSPWDLVAVVRPVGGATNETSEVSVDLHYGGQLWAPPLEAALRWHVERAVPRLQAVVAARR